MSRNVVHHLAIGIAGILMAASAAPAAAQTILIQSPTYTSITTSATCTVGECGNYAWGQRIEGEIRLNAPLPPSRTSMDIRSMIAEVRINDGLRDYTLSPGFVIATARVSTNAAAVITNHQFQIQRVPGPPYGEALPNDPNSRMSGVTITPSASWALSNVECRQRSVAPSPTNACSWMVQDSHSSSGMSVTPPTVTYVPAPPPAVIPTLTEWAMVLFALLLAGGAALHVQRRGDA